MPSPFPGMDPWLESPATFPDFHSGFLSALRATLNVQLQPPFYAALSTRVFMESSDRNVEPDIDVLTTNDYDASPGGTATLTQLETEMLLVPLAVWPSEEFTEQFIEIRSTQSDNRLITTVELLSLKNKTRGQTSQDLYMAKQWELRSAGVNLVEIDLLRGGRHATQADLSRLRRVAPRHTYHVSIYPPEYDSHTRAAAFELHHRLPTIPIPLTAEVPAIAVDLQPVFDRTYDESIFGRRVNYRTPPTPPLTADQQAWAEGILTARGT